MFIFVLSVKDWILLCGVYDTDEIMLALMKEKMKERRMKGHHLA